MASSAFYAPGTIVGISVDTGHPLAWGMEAEAAACVSESQAFRLLPYTRESRIVASYARGDVLRSGWIVGEEKMAGKAAMFSLK